MPSTATTVSKRRSGSRVGTESTGVPTAVQQSSFTRAPTTVPVGRSAAPDKAPLTGAQTEGSSLGVTRLTPLERLSRIRMAATRISHHLEAHRHASGVYFFNSNDRTQVMADEINVFFAKVDAAMGHVLGATAAPDTPETTSEPRQIQESRKRVEPLLSKGESLFKLRLQRNVGATSSDGSIAYPMLQVMLLRAIVDDLRELRDVLGDTPDGGGPHSVPSTALASAQLLQDAVHHYIDDFDSIFRRRIPKLINEMYNESVRFCGVVSSSSSSPRRRARATKQGKAVSTDPPETDVFPDDAQTPIRMTDELVNEEEEMDEEVIPSVQEVVARATDEASRMVISLFLVDIAVGIAPSRSVRPVLDHFQHLIAECQSGVNAELDAVNAVKGKLDGGAGASTTDEAAKQGRQADVEAQLAALDIMQTAIQDAKDVADKLGKVWTKKEEELLGAAIEGSNQLLLVEQKLAHQDSIIDQVKAAAEELQRTCVPFLAPQYSRRNQKTYESPCQIRVSFRFFDDSRGTFVNLTNLNTSVVKETGEPVDEYLLPTTDQIWLTFDKFPEMVKSARCSLRHTGHRKDAPAHKEPKSVTVTSEIIELHAEAMEEKHELGGYFIINGGEKIIRTLLLQRANIPLCISRPTFTSAGPGFSDKAIVLRCKRASGMSCLNYFFYSASGEVLFSFARRLVWHVPATLLLFSMAHVTPMDLYNLLVADSMGSASSSRGARVEALLQHHRAKPYGGLTHYKEFLAVLGRMFRQYQQHANVIHFLGELGSHGAQCHQDAWYGLFMVRRHVLPHLNRDVGTPDLPFYTEAMISKRSHRGGDDVAAAKLQREEVAAAKNAEALRDWPGPDIEAELNEKFFVLIEIVRLLYNYIEGSVETEGNDIPCYQELLLPSQCLLSSLSTCLSRSLKFFVFTLAQRFTPEMYRGLVHRGANFGTHVSRFRQLIQQAAPLQRHHPLGTLQRMLGTGNFTGNNEEFDFIPQESGWVVHSDHINFYRFFEQFRVTHRGKRIADLRSSDVRKYPGEAFGFFDMVHSPDGTDCGIINHLCLSTVVSSALPAPEVRRIQAFLRSYEGMIGKESLLVQYALPCVEAAPKYLPVWLDGTLAGFLPAVQAEALVAELRSMKMWDAWKGFVGSEQGPSIYSHLEQWVNRFGYFLRSQITPLHLIEVVCVPPIPPSNAKSIREPTKVPPCVMIFTESGRIMRPIRDLATGNVIFIGTWEQLYLDIAAVPGDLAQAKKDLQKRYKFMELNGSNLLSLTSATIPFFEYNCSPRNLFQCGLSKQTAGTQMQALGWRREPKLFRMYTPQRYISRTLAMDAFGLDRFSIGVNAVVAISSYTGYDLDDAVIIGATPVQRGMLNACVTVAKIVDLHDPGKEPSDSSKQANAKRQKEGVSVFCNRDSKSGGVRFCNELLGNGLPPKRRPVGLTTFDWDLSAPSLTDESAVYATARRVTRQDPVTGQVIFEYTRPHITRWGALDKGENASLESVIPLLYDGPDVVSALFVFRLHRPPVVGDKFSSRHGQKGTLPLLISMLDMPFSSVTGITPDVIINPHAFPSRMTVGMVLEIMCSKLGSIQGRFIDNSPWSVNDSEPVVAEDIGRLLVGNGFNRHGRESMVCGISGESMDADVFVGVCGYQRMRHMVNDKWQSRAQTDAGHSVVTKTGQPVKGRKRHGGVRVGEMERDGLISHGAAEVVVDRLLHVSDATKAVICASCGGLLCVYEVFSSATKTLKECKYCGASESAGGSAAGSSGGQWLQAFPLIDLPQVLRLWAAELAAVGVRVAIKLADPAASASTKAPAPRPCPA